MSSRRCAFVLSSGGSFNVERFGWVEVTKDEDGDEDMLICDQLEA
jgi:hypothetical protein